MAGRRKTLRLTVSYDSLGVVLRRAEVVDFVPVLKDPTPAPGTDALWVSVEGGGRRFARRLPDPAISREVFAPDGAITRAPGVSRSQTIDVPWWGDETDVVFRAPADGDGRGAGLTASLATGAQAGPWREAGRFRAADLAAMSTEDHGALMAAPVFPAVALPFGTGNPRALKLVFLAEGFTSADLATYRATVDAFLQKLLVTPPFDGMTAALAAVRVDSVSTQSGIDDPASGATVSTWLDGRFGVGDMRRLIEVNQDRAMEAAARAAGSRSAFVALVVANTAEYGGSGGQVAVFSRNGAAADIALHELGHTLFGLADEYSDAVPSPGRPAEPNVTAKPDSGSAAWGPRDRQRLKWKAHLADGAVLPTTSNPDCSHPDARPGPGGVGAFEGGKYKHCGVFRPTADCKMRTLTAPFCPVCREQITAKLRTFL